MSPVEPEEPNTRPEANHLRQDATPGPDRPTLDYPTRPDPAQGPRHSPTDTTDDSDHHVVDKPAKPSDAFAPTIPVEPIAATLTFEPVAATRSFEPVGMTRPYEPYKPSEPDQLNEPYETAGSMPQDDLRQHQNPENPGGQRPPGPALRPDATSIGAGLVFFILGGAYLLAASGHLTVNAAWTISLLFIGLGLSGFLGAALNSRRRR